jgi:hypothetical protein
MAAPSVKPLVKEIKDRLRAFLADPEQEQEFRVWFALMLRDVHSANNVEAEALAHQIVATFARQEHGPDAPRQLTTELTQLVSESEAGVYFATDPFSVKTGTASSDLQEGAVFAFEGLQVGAEYASEPA